MNQNDDNDNINPPLSEFYDTHPIVNTFHRKQQPAFDEKKKYYFSVDDSFQNDNGEIVTVKRYKGYDDINDFFDIYDTISYTKKHFYYMITDECVEVYDIDGLWEDTFYEGKNLEEIISDFLYVRKLFLNENLFTNSQDQEETYYISTACSDTKVSIHITIRNGYKFKNILEQKFYTQQFLLYISENNYQIKFDKAIYTPNRNMRIVGSSKHGSDRILKKKDDTQLDIEFLASFTCDDDIFIERTDGEKMGEEITRNTNNFECKPADGELSKLVDLIYESINDEDHSLCDDEVPNKMCYDDFKKLAFAIIKSSDGDCLSLFRKIFELYRHADDHTCKTMYNNMSKYTNYGWTLSSLHYWASENSKYEEQFKKEKMLREYDAVKKTYENRSKTCEEKTYSNFYDFNSFVNTISTRKAIEKCFQETIVEVQNFGKKPFFIVKTAEYDERLKTNVNCFTTHIQDMNCLKKITYIINENYEKELEKFLTFDPNADKRKKAPPKPKKVTQQWLYHPSQPSIFNDLHIRNMIPFKENIVNEPYFLKEPEHLKNKFNVFAGFELLNNNKYFDTKTSYFEESKTYHHMKHYLCPGDEVFEYILNLIAHMIQKPEIAPDMAVLFMSKQGLGKDLVFGHFISGLIGAKYYVNFGDIADFLGHFTASEEGLLLTVINEICEGHADNMMYKKAGIMKDKITRKKCKIEKKGIDPYFVKHTSRYFMFTNHERAICIDNSDRRHLLISCNNEKANDQAYFLHIVNEVDNPDFLKSAFAFFANRDISSFNTRVIPQTEYKDRIKILSMNSSLRFVASMFTEYELEDTFKIQTNDFYELYKFFCKSVSTKHVARKTFIEQIKCVLVEATGGRYTYTKEDLSPEGTITKIFNTINNQGFQEKLICDGLSNRKYLNIDKNKIQENLKLELKVDELDIDEI